MISLSILTNIYYNHLIIKQIDMIKEKTREECLIELEELKLENKALKVLKEKRSNELIVANKELLFQNKEKEKRANELIIANKELLFQNEEKEKRAEELIIANKELLFQNDEKEKRASELIVANKELAYQFALKEKRAIELLNAEESDRLKSAFLANMSHEIRTPMNGILGFSELLKRKNITKEKRGEYLELIDHEGRRLLNIINDIVDISKIDSKLVTIEISTCNLNSLFDEIYLKYSVSRKTPKIEFKVVKGLEDKDSVINTDSNRLVQILSNLIENALKFTKEGIIELGYSIRSNEIIFYVKDSGLGIKIEDQEHIFGRFNQSKQHNTHDSGSGLGLSISKGLAELLGGDVWVESEINQGSIFYVSIPYKKECFEPVEELEKNYNSEIIKNDFKILIAEDEFIIFLFLRECLSDFNCTIIHASNGEKAINKFKQDPTIDLILMDLNMPHVNGYDALKAIRKINKEVPIIAQTGLAMSGDKEKILQAGFNDYISKPISIEILINIINKHVQKKNDSIHF